MLYCIKKAISYILLIIYYYYETLNTSGAISDEALQALSEDNSDEIHISNQTEKTKDIHFLGTYII